MTHCDLDQREINYVVTRTSIRDTLSFQFR